jgi:hypothetical protein
LFTHIKERQGKHGAKHAFRFRKTLGKDKKPVETCYPDTEALQANPQEALPNTQRTKKRAKVKVSWSSEYSGTDIGKGTCGTNFGTKNIQTRNIGTEKIGKSDIGKTQIGKRQVGERKIGNRHIGKRYISRGYRIGTGYIGSANVSTAATGIAWDDLNWSRTTEQIGGSRSSTSMGQ